MDDPIEIELEGVSTPRPAGSERQPARGPSPRPRRIAIVVGAAALFTAGVVVGRSGGDPARPASATPATSSVPRTTTTTVPDEVPVTAPTTTPGSTLAPVAPEDRRVVELGRPLLPVQTGLELVGVGRDGDFVEIDLDTGTVTVTDVPTISRNDVAFGAASLTVTDDAAILASLATGRVAMLRSGDPAAIAPPKPLDPAEGGLHTGPEPNTFWQMAWGRDGGAGGRLRVLDVDGRELGEDPITSSAAGSWWVIGPDHRGGVLVQSGTGTYTVGVDGPRRLTNGELVAIGRNHAIATECDDRLECSKVLIDRGTGARQPVELDGSGVGIWNTSVESVSPDGTAVVVQRSTRFLTDEVVLVDLRTGAATVLVERHDAGFSVGWSADGRFALYLDRGRLFAVDRPLGTYRPVATPGDDLPELELFTLRPWRAR